MPIFEFLCPNCGQELQRILPLVDGKAPEKERCRKCFNWAYLVPSKTGYRRDHTVNS